MASSYIPSPADNQQQDSHSRCAYVYTVYDNCEEDGPHHPKMRSSLYLMVWQLLGAFASLTGMMHLFTVTGLREKMDDSSDCDFISLIFGFLNLFTLICWCFPRDLPMMGSARKMILDMAALLAAMLTRTTPTYSSSSSDEPLFVTLISITTLVYVRIKHCFVFYDIKLRDILLVVLLQTVIYYTPDYYYVGPIVSCLCLVGYRLLASACNTT
ncbi:hypothetical protein LINPERPRIM_LOCUS36419, partial [Linum perenne]